MLIRLLILILLFVSTFSFSNSMTDSHIVPKWLYSGCVLFVLGIIISLSVIKNKLFRLNIHRTFACIVFIGVCQGIYAILQFVNILPSRFVYRVVGGFDNPAGLATYLSCSIPFCIYIICRTKEKCFRYLYITSLIIISIALILTGSRAGILAGMIFPVVYIICKRIQKVSIRILLYIILIVFIIILYYIKKDSADGRILILCCSLNMIKDSPIWGYGLNGVQKKYMDYQAKWFNDFPNSEFAPLADNVKNIFNEYVTIVVNYGILGWFVLIVYLFFLVNCYKKTKTLKDYCALFSLSSISIIACFSYPLRYPSTWIFIILNIYVLMGDLRLYKFLTSKWTCYILSISLLLVSICGLNIIIRRINDEIKWNSVARNILLENKDVVLKKYEDLIPSLGENAYFLYNYAAMLSVSQKYEEALKIALKCKQYMADYDLELLLGELYEKKHQYKYAVSHYLSAQNMCPNRFVPLYKQFKAYKIECDTNNMIAIGKTILTKEIKVPSKKIDNIINNVKIDLVNIIQGKENNSFDSGIVGQH